MTSARPEEVADTISVRLGLRQVGYDTTFAGYAGVLRYDAATLSAVEAEFLEDVLQVLLDRALGRAEDACDLAVALALGNPQEDLGFAVGGAPAPFGPHKVNQCARAAESIR